MPKLENDPVEVLVRALRDKRPLVRKSAVQALSHLEDLPERMVPPLVQTLGDADVAVRLAAGQVLVQLGQAAVPFLLTALEKDDPDWRSAVIVILGRIGSAARVAVPTLTRFQEDAILGPLATDALARIQWHWPWQVSPEILERWLLWFHLALSLGFLVLEIVMDLSGRFGLAGHVSLNAAAAWGVIGLGMGALAGGLWRGRRAALASALVLGYGGGLAGALVGGLMGTIFQSVAARLS